MLIQEAQLKKSGEFMIINDDKKERERLMILFLLPGSAHSSQNSNISTGGEGWVVVNTKPPERKYHS